MSQEGMQFRSTDNGDIFAEKSDGTLMGVWFHSKSRGTIRISGGGDPTENNQIVGHSTSLTKWIARMYMFNRIPENQIARDDL